MMLAALIIVSPTFLNEPLRRRLETTLNAEMQGYTVQLPGVSLHPWSFSLTLLGLSVRQIANPDPPVLELREMTAGVHWRALLSLRLVADLDVLSPRVHFDSRILASEAGDAVPVQDKGWQEAIESIYPLKFNEVRISDGSVTYIDDPRRPVELTHIEMLTTNIRNVRSEPGSFPSPLRLRATAFGTGRLAIDGAADYLASPNPAVSAAIDLSGIPLLRAAPVADDVNLKIEGGTLTAAGTFEAIAGHQHARLRTATIEGIKIDYVHAPRAAATQRAARAATATAELAAKPGVRIDVDDLHVVDATVGVVDTTTDPNYRVFVDHADVHVLNVSNQPAQGRGWVMLRGRFMGSGPSDVWMSFVADPQAADANIAIQIRDTDMRTMNDLFRAQGDFDVVAGRFSFFSELYLNRGHIEGYIKPLFADVDVYDTRQERGDSFGQHVYEGLVGGLAGLLENRNAETATRASVEGRTDAPQLSTWEIVFNLVRNAFFKAILPGLDHARMGNRSSTTIGTDTDAK